MRSALILAALLVAALCSGASKSAADSPGKLRAWTHIKSVLLSAEFGGRDGVIERWTRSPKITVVGGSGQDLFYVQRVIGELNAALDGTAITLRHGNPGAADIGIIFTPTPNFAEIAAMYGFDYVRGGVGFAGLTVDHRHRARLAVVLIADELEADERRATVIQELYHSLGVVNDSPYFPSSVLFEDSDGGSSATALAMVDRKLLKLLYAYLKPGDREADLRRAFDLYWDTLE